MSMGKTNQPSLKDGPRTAAEALGAYAAFRVAGIPTEEEAGLDAFLELIGRYCDEVAPGLLDTVNRKRLEKSAGERPFREGLEAGRLMPLLLPCARMYPYMIAASPPVSRVFAREIPQLAAWLKREGLAGEAGLNLFRTGWPEARADIEKLVHLQVAISRAADIIHFSRPEFMVVGHYRITEVTRLGLWVDSGDGPVGPVRLPGESLALFSADQEVSLAFFRGGAGWIPLASSLPIHTEQMEKLMEQARRSLHPLRPSTPF